MQAFTLLYNATWTNGSVSHNAWRYTTCSLVEVVIVEWPRAFLHQLAFALLLSRLGRVDASITLLSLLHQLTFGLLLSRLGRVDASITLLSLLHLFFCQCCHNEYY